MTVRPQDLGGRRGFGRIPIDQDEPVFHHDWEGRVIAGILATIGAGLYNVDQFREGIDDLDPLSYFGVGYYGRWLHTLEANCVKAGVLGEDEIEQRIEELASGSAVQAAGGDGIAEEMRKLIAEGAPNARAAERAPRYRAGDRVRGRRLPGERHARLPVYAQGRPGTVEAVHAAFPFPDTNRRGEGEQPEHVYTVVFDAAELWEDAEPRSQVSLDLWESYVEPAGDET